MREPNKVVATPVWEYQVVEEGNPTALGDRLNKMACHGWTPVSMGFAGDHRLLLLVKRRIRRRTDANAHSRHTAASGV